MRFLFAQNKPLTCAFEIRKWFKKLESNVRTSLGLFFDDNLGYNCHFHMD